jgi:hypothetical protein
MADNPDGRIVGSTNPLPRPRACIEASDSPPWMPSAGWRTYAWTTDYRSLRRTDMKVSPLCLVP